MTLRQPLPLHNIPVVFDNDGSEARHMAFLTQIRPLEVSSEAMTEVRRKFEELAECLQRSGKTLRTAAEAFRLDSLFIPGFHEGPDPNGSPYPRALWERNLACMDEGLDFCPKHVGEAKSRARREAAKRVSSWFSSDPFSLSVAELPRNIYFVEPPRPPPSAARDLQRSLLLAAQRWPTPSVPGRSARWCPTEASPFTPHYEPVWPSPFFKKDVASWSRGRNR